MSEVTAFTAGNSVDTHFMSILTDTFAKALKAKAGFADELIAKLVNCVSSKTTDYTQIMTSFQSGIPAIELKDNPPTQVTEAEMQLRKIVFKNFRGLRDLQLEFKKEKKNLLIYGGNGKGKSSIVYGLEWIFGGQLDEIEEKSIKHIDSATDPSFVQITFSDGGTAQRSFSDQSLSGVGGGPRIVKGHPTPESFILRRSKLLRFMDSSSVDRYQRIVGLMGLEWLNDTLEAFNQAFKKANEDLLNSTMESGEIFKQYPPLSVGNIPKNQGDIYLLCSERLSLVGLDPLVKYEEIESRLVDVRTKRNPANKAKLIKVESAIESLKENEDLDWNEALVELNRMRRLIAALQISLAVDSNSLEMLSSALILFEKEKDLSLCPICERSFDNECSYATTLSRLSDRVLMLGKLKQVIAENSKFTAIVVSRLRRESRDLNKALLKSFPTKKEQSVISNCVNVINRVVDCFVDEDNKANSDNIDIQLLLFKSKILNRFKNRLATRLGNQFKQLTLSSPVDVEDAYRLLVKAKSDLPKLDELIMSSKVKSEFKKQAQVAYDEFKASKKSSLQKLLEDISGTVLAFYKFIHDDGDHCEVSECTNVYLKQTDRGKSGSIEFKTDFFDTTYSCDPKQYLSEGHLDSLGLCIYLASVKHFNKIKTLIVLDDVLTSVDKDHRHKVTDLIFERFADYQVIITTHDNNWYEQLKVRIDTSHSLTWGYKSFSHWTRNRGPIEDLGAGLKTAVSDAIRSNSLQYAGGSLRKLTELHCQRIAEAVNLPMPYRRSGQYTLPDFSSSGIFQKAKSGIERVENSIKKQAEESAGIFNADQLTEFRTHLRLLVHATEVVFSASFMNKLAHNKIDVEQVSERELKDFATNLLLLHDYCTSKKLSMMK